MGEMLDTLMIMRANMEAQYNGTSDGDRLARMSNEGFLDMIEDNLRQLLARHDEGRPAYTPRWLPHGSSYQVFAGQSRSDLEELLQWVRRCREELRFMPALVADIRAGRR